jgi:putative membrane protein
VTEPRETQTERTALTWQRTALGVIGVAVLIGHRAVSGGTPALLLPAGACAMLGVLLLSGVGAVRDRQLREAMARDEPVSSPGLARLVTGVVAVVALSATVVVLVGRAH